MGNNDVRIILTAVDRASSELKKVESSMSSTLTAFGAATGIAAGVGLAIKKVVDKTVDYAFQVDDLSRALGTNAEESSKLIQMADDLRIDVGTLKVGFKAALKEGVIPSIEGLKDLAKEYQAIQDPAKKSQFAMEKFGKAGLELNKILELTPQQIDAMAASAEKAGKVLDDQGVKKAKEYYAQIDNLGDAWEGLQIRAGSTAIPIVTDALTRLNEEMDKGITIGGLFTQGVGFWKDTLTDADEKLEAAAEAAGRLGEGVGPDMQEKLRGMGGALGEVDSAADGAAGELSNVAAALGEITSAKLGAEALDALSKAWTSGEITDMKEYETKLREIGTGLLGLPEDQVNASIALFRLKQDFADNKIELDGLITGLFDLDEALKPLPYSISPVTGEFMSLGGKANEARLKVDNLYKSLENIDGRHFKAWLDVIASIKKSPADIVKVTGGQHGLDMIVPPGFPGDTYPVLATSGERVTITPQGKSSGGGGNIEIYMDNNFNVSGVTPQQVMNMIDRQLSDRLRNALAFAQAGGGYQGM